MASANVPDRKIHKFSICQKELDQVARIVATWSAANATTSLWLGKLYQNSLFICILKSHSKMFRFCIRIRFYFGNHGNRPVGQVFRIKCPWGHSRRPCCLARWLWDWVCWSSIGRSSAGHSCCRTKIFWPPVNGQLFHRTRNLLKLNARWPRRAYSVQDIPGEKAFAHVVYLLRSVQDHSKSSIHHFKTTRMRLLTTSCRC